MLVLTRKVNEALLIGEGEIRIVVLSVQGDQVKLGIEAPKSITIMREEIVQAEAQNQEASHAISPDALTKLAENPTTTPLPPRTPKSR